MDSCKPKRKCNKSNKSFLPNLKDLKRRNKETKKLQPLLKSSVKREELKTKLKDKLSWSEFKNMMQTMLSLLLTKLLPVEPLKPADKSMSLHKLNSPSLLELEVSINLTHEASESWDYSDLYNFIMVLSSESTKPP